MKSSFFSALSLALTLSSAAFACEGNNICTGDTVYPDTYSRGSARVIAVNPSTGEITVQGNYASTYDRFDRQELSIPRGCVGNLCVGQQVMPDTYSRGNATIVALNPFTNVFTVQGNISSTYDRFSFQELAKMRGCLRDLCVGDLVIPETFSRGDARIVAVNVSTREIVVQGNISSTLDRFTEMDIGLTDGCMNGICVGDKVFPSTYSRGYAMVVAINRFTQSYTVQGNISSTLDRFTFTDLGLIEACSKYSPEQRKK